MDFILHSQRSISLEQCQYSPYLYVYVTEGNCAVVLKASVVFHSYNDTTNYPPPPPPPPDPSHP